MSGNEIYLKIKSFFVDTATPRIKAFTASMAKQCSGAARAVAGITAAFGCNNTPESTL